MSPPAGEVIRFGLVTVVTAAAGSGQRGTELVQYFAYREARHR